MTPKKKAKELVDKYINLYEGWNVSFCAKCALIAVDEILNSGHGWNKTTSSFVKYWQQVKQEIQTL